MLIGAYMLLEVVNPQLTELKVGNKDELELTLEADTSNTLEEGSEEAYVEYNVLRIEETRETTEK